MFDAIVSSLTPDGIAAWLTVCFSIGLAMGAMSVAFMAFLPRHRN